MWITDEPVVVADLKRCLAELVPESHGRWPIDERETVIIRWLPRAALVAVRIENYYHT